MVLPAIFQWNWPSHFPCKSSRRFCGQT